MNHIKVKKREVIFSIIIICVSLVLGLIISNNVQDSMNRENQKYRLALRVDNDEASFQHLLKTSAGDALVSGTIKAVDTVTNPEIKGEYFYIEKYIERYEVWYETETKVDSEGNSYTETVRKEGWRYYRNLTETANQYSFMGETFSTFNLELPYRSKLPLNEQTLTGNTMAADVLYGWFYEHSSWREWEGDLRWCYYVVRPSFSGTALVNLNDGKMTNALNPQNNIAFEDISIENLLEKIDHRIDNFMVWFWIIWIIITAIIVFLFYVGENRWLDDKRNKNQPYFY